MGEVLNVGVIGAGLWGAQQAHVFATLPNCNLVGICDLDGSRAGDLANQHKTRAFTDHHDLLAAPEVDAIGIATPDFAHTDLILDALAADKHVLTEKPLATTVAEARKVVQAADASGRVLMVDFHNRVNPVIATATHDIASGAIGRVIHASARLSNTTHVPLEMLRWAAQSSALWFLGSHTIDALRFVLDAEVASVSALRTEGALHEKGVRTADAHLALLEFSNGTIATLENSWVLSTGNPQIFDFRIGLVGEEGQIDLNPSHNGAYTRTTDGGMRFTDVLGVTEMGGARIGGFVRESIARFVDAVLDGKPPLATAEDGLRATQVLAAIEESAATGRPVRVDYQG